MTSKKMHDNAMVDAKFNTLPLETQIDYQVHDEWLTHKCDLAYGFTFDTHSECHEWSEDEYNKKNSEWRSDLEQKISILEKNSGERLRRTHAFEDFEKILNDIVPTKTLYLTPKYANR